MMILKKTRKKINEKNGCPTTTTIKKNAKREIGKENTKVGVRSEDFEKEVNNPDRASYFVFLLTNHNNVSFIFQCYYYYYKIVFLKHLIIQMDIGA